MYSSDLIEVINEQDVDMNPKDKNRVDICVINNGFPEHLKEHIRLTKKHFKSSFYYTVFNIYFDENEDKIIRDICKDNNIPVISFRIKDRSNCPHFHERLKNKLNYAYNKYVIPRGCKYFGVLQQDVFLVQDFDVKKIMKNKDCFGWCLDARSEVQATKDINKDVWYLWEGFAFLKTKKFPKFSWAANFNSLSTYDENKALGECGVLSYYEYFYKYDRKITDWINYNELRGLGIGNIKIHEVKNPEKKETEYGSLKRAEHIEDFGLYLHGLGCGLWDHAVKDDIIAKNHNFLKLLKRF